MREKIDEFIIQINIKLQFTPDSSMEMKLARKFLHVYFVVAEIMHAILLEFVIVPFNFCRLTSLREDI